MGRVGGAQARQSLKIFHIRLRWLALLLVAAPGAASADLGPVFHHIGVNQGLPDSRIEALAQDANGFVWIATKGGLIRHAGDRLDVLVADPEDPGSLPASNILSLFPASDGTVWAGVSGTGVVQIDATLAIRRHELPLEQGGRLPGQHVWSFAEACDGSLWLMFAQGGVARLDPDNDEFELIEQTAANGMDPQAFNLKLRTDSHCRLWLVQTTRLAVLEGSAPGPFSAVFDRQAEGRDPLYDLHEDSDGRLLLLSRNEISLLGTVDQPIESLARETFHVSDRAPTRLIDDPGGEGYWLGTLDGLARIGRTGQALTMLRSRADLEDGLPGSWIVDLLTDHEGGVWVATLDHGVGYLAPGHEAFRRFRLQTDPVDPAHHEPILRVAIDGDHVWLGTRNRGAIRFHPATGEQQPIEEFLAQPPEHRPAGARGLLIHGKWLYLLDPRRVNRFHLAEHRLEQVAQFGDLVGVGSAHDAGDGSLWITMLADGLALLDPDSGDYQHFHRDGEGRHRADFSGVNTISRGPDGYWWVATSDGVFKGSPDEGFERVEALSQYPTTSLDWHGEMLWLGHEGGLERWRLAEDRLLRELALGRQDGLPPGRIFSVVRDGRGRVWVLMSTGLVHVEAEHRLVRAYRQRDGLATAEFSLYGSQLSDDGQLLIGTASSLVMVDLDRMGEVGTVPPVFVTALEAGSSRHEFLPDRREPITLGYRDNAVMLEYRALSFINPEHNRYAIRLVGWDSDWLELTGQTRFIYSNLPSGRYRFQVRASGADGQWNLSGDEQVFIIEPAPWRTSWAMAGYLLLAVVAGGAGWREVRRARQRRRALEDSTRKRQIAENQRRFIARLNASLDPAALARVICEELIEVTGASSARLGFSHEGLPRRIFSAPPAAGDMTRQAWQHMIATGDTNNRQFVEFQAAGRNVATVVLDADGVAFAPDSSFRAGLIADTANQALSNALLLIKVSRLADDARRASAAKSEFVATMSHEIRTPLHGVLGMVELLKRADIGPEHRQMIMTLARSGRQLQRIIDDVLDLSRIEAGRLSLDARIFELSGLLEQQLDLHAANAAEAGLDLRLRIAATLPPVWLADPDRLGQVLGNLISNAIKFTERGAVEIAAETDAEGALKLSVSDTGPGIDPEAQARLFEPFTQLDASITRSHSGSGLGLAICRRLVDAMGGQISLRSRLSAGSRFQLRLPSPDQALSPTRLPMSSLLAGHVLAVAGAAPWQRIVRRLGRRWGVVTVRAGKTVPETTQTLLVLDEEALSVAESCLTDTAQARNQARNQNDGPASLLVCLPPKIEALPDGLAGRVTRLRWPLVESRLIAALLDQRLGSST